MQKLAVAIVLSSVVVMGCASRPGREVASGEAPNTVPGEASAGANLAAQFASAAGDRVFFAYDQATLSAEAREVLRRQAQWLQRHPNVRAVIAGHCDERGTREYNLALGARRAAAARDYLVSLGVAGARLTTTSYGKDRPLDPRSNPEGWAVNRNAHTDLVGGPSS